MSVNKFNAEGYFDPTAYDALSNIEKEKKQKKKIVLICSPYAGDIEGNARHARRYGICNNRESCSYHSTFDVPTVS